MTLLRAETTEVSVLGGHAAAAPAADPVSTRNADRPTVLQRAISGVKWAVVPVALVLAWHVAVETGAVPATLVANPVDSVVRLFELTSDGTIAEHVLASLRRIVIGFSLGSAVGILIGAIIGTSRGGARLLEPTALTLIPVPAVAWIPLLVVLFGIGETSKVALVSIGSATTLILATAAGVRGASRDLVEVANLYEKSRFTLFRTVLLPSAVPGIIASARVAMALSWTLLVAAEVIASANGLGWFIWDSRNFARPASMIAGMMVIGVLGKLTDTALARLGAHLTRWNRSYGS